MDSEAFERLKKGSEQDISSLYPLYLAPFVNFISRAFKCPHDKAAELYPEAFTILYFNIRKGKLAAPLKSTIQTYLNSTGWNLYHRRHLDKYQRDKLPLEDVGREIETISMVEEAIIQKERTHHLQLLLEKIGDPCKKILMGIYFDETNYKELATTMEVEEGTLRKRKFDCLGKMRKLFNEHNLEL